MDAKRNSRRPFLPSTPVPIVWSRGHSETEDVIEHLLEVSRSAAYAVLANWQSEDDAELLWSAVSSGLAVETAIKLALARVNPVLLADSKSKHDTYLLLAGVSDEKATPSSIFTIGAFEAALRVRGIPGAAISQAECEQVFRVRNAAAHMGLVYPKDLELAVRNMASVIEGLRDAIGEEADNFWGDYQSLVTKLLNAKSTDIQRRIETKKLAAKRFFEVLQTTVTKQQLEGLLTALEADTKFRINDLEVVGQTCPVCKRLGYMKRDIPENYPVEGGFVLDTRPERFRFRFAYPELFSCPVCHLSFDAEECDEVDEFESEIEIPPDEWTSADAAEFEAEQLERDWDRWR